MGFRICCYNKLWVAYNFLFYFSGWDGMDLDGLSKNTALFWCFFFFYSFSFFFSILHYYNMHFLFTPFLLHFFFVCRISFFLFSILMMMMITPLRLKSFKFSYTVHHRWMGFMDSCKRTFFFFSSSFNLTSLYTQ
jgi:hypothetical protein